MNLFKNNLELFNPVYMYNLLRDLVYLTLGSRVDFFWLAFLFLALPIFGGRYVKLLFLLPMNHQLIRIIFLNIPSF